MVLISAKEENGKRRRRQHLSRGAREIVLFGTADYIVLSIGTRSSEGLHRTVITLLCPSIFECQKNERPFQITKL